jgi:hypothetical protein
MSENIRKIVIVVNPTCKGLRLPESAFNKYKELTNQPNLVDCKDIPRDDKHLVQIVEELKVDGKFKTLHIMEIPIYIKWNIVEYFGMEQIHEYHNAW